jgi:uncharacterized membrane protein (UPF0127 family)
MLTSQSMHSSTITPRALIVSLAILSIGCSASTGCRNGKTSSPTVILHAKGGAERPFRVEVMRSPEKQARGMMYREHMDADTGMLFVYRGEHQRHFWMKNTNIPLDMIFIGQNRRIVGIVHKAEPMTTTRREVDAPSSFVLEVKGGTCKKHGIKVGSTVRFDKIPGLPD